MRLGHTLLTVPTLLTLAGCEPGLDPTASPLPGVPARQAAGPATSGGGHFSIAALDLDIQFAFTALRTSPDGSATGEATHSVIFGGELVEFHTDVTCVTVDEATGRAWIGGVVRANRSTHPAFTTDIHEPGRDIWFRVVDYGEGEGAPQPDRSTFVGFEGSADIITSEEYCAVQPWPEGDARTNPVFAGNIQVRP